LLLVYLLVPVLCGQKVPTNAHRFPDSRRQALRSTQKALRRRRSALARGPERGPLLALQLSLPGKAEDTGAGCLSGRGSRQGKSASAGSEAAVERRSRPIGQQAGGGKDFRGRGACMACPLEYGQERTPLSLRPQTLGGRPLPRAGVAASV